MFSSETVCSSAPTIHLWLLSGHLHKGQSLCGPGDMTTMRTTSRSRRIPAGGAHGHGKSVALHTLSRQDQRSRSRGAGAPHCPQELNLISRDPDSEAGAGSRVGVGLNRLDRLRREHFHTCARSQPRADLELIPGMGSLQCPWGLTCSPQD